MSVTIGEAFGINHRLTTCRHRVVQSCQVVAVSGLKPSRDDCWCQFFLACLSAVIRRQALQPFPQIFYQTKIWTVPWLLQKWNLMWLEVNHFIHFLAIWHERRMAHLAQRCREPMRTALVREQRWCTCWHWLCLPESVVIRHLCEPCTPSHNTASLSVRGTLANLLPRHDVRRWA